MLLHDPELHHAAPGSVHHRLASAASPRRPKVLRVVELLAGRVKCGLGDPVGGVFRVQPGLFATGAVPGSGTQATIVMQLVFAMDRVVKQKVKEGKRE